MKRSEEEFRVDVMCVISNYLDGKWMLEERAKAGAKALSAWLKRCRATVGVVKSESFTSSGGVSGVSAPVWR